MAHFRQSNDKSMSSGITCVLSLAHVRHGVLLIHVRVAILVLRRRGYTQLFFSKAQSHVSTRLFEYLNYASGVRLGRSSHAFCRRRRDAASDAV